MLNSLSIFLFLSSRRQITPTQLGTQDFPVAAVWRKNQHCCMFRFLYCHDIARRYPVSFLSIQSQHSAVILGPESYFQIRIMRKNYRSVSQSMGTNGINNNQIVPGENDGTSRGKRIGGGTCGSGNNKTVSFIRCQ